MNYSSDTNRILQLLQVRGIGPAKVRQLIDLAEIHSVNIDEIISNPILVRAVLNEKQLAAVLEVANDDYWLKKTLEDLQNINASIVSIADDAYPICLKSRLGDKAPVMLTFLGNSSLLCQPSVGFCGSRAASPKGLETAVDCAEQFSAVGVNVVSGFAAGVDMSTHVAALRNGGTTTVVLAEGILHFSVKREIKSVFDWNRVLVVSEFLPNLSWNVHQAMQRNQTIIGLSEAMILIEAREKGGSIEAGKSAQKLGIPFWVADFQGSPETAEGNRILIERGARPLRRSKTTNRAKLDAIFQVLHKVSRELINLNETTTTSTTDLRDVEVLTSKDPQSEFDKGYDRINWSL